jgi:recombinational DNA repair ATPase RecF
VTNSSPSLGRVNASLAYQSTGYQMIETIKIRNFRSYDDVEIKDARRINVIVGENGSGKTALLEALFLAMGPSPEIALRTRLWRGTRYQLRKSL